MTNPCPTNGRVAHDFIFSKLVDGRSIFEHRNRPFLFKKIETYAMELAPLTRFENIFN